MFVGDRPSHIGQKMKKQTGFEVGYSKALVLGDNRRLKQTRAQSNAYQNGGKVTLPQHMLEDMTNKNLLDSDRPVQFRIHSTRTSIVCLCGVNDFHMFEKEQIFIPDWMQEYMDCKPGDNLFFSDIKLSPCTFLKFKPESCDFYELKDHENLLNSMLPNFSAICQGQWLCLTIDEKQHWLQVLECQPTFASLINTNVKVDFQSADGLEQYETQKNAELELNKFKVEDFFQIGGTQNNLKVQKIEVKNVFEDEEDDTATKKLEQKTFIGKGRKL
ncbi:Putative_ubiquitin fusion degradation protein [Hexamita inflata]|uniref:Ubiquitin fusion degradation protein n=1 Tax=Hexamita inflata TaxID=28002 RepID=A0AA86RB69_9EUKA|nr:Putative ubiquitin fusion degradation protein [Hexamita inflata]